MSLCETYKPYMAALADGQADAIPPRERREVEAHLAGCPACREDLAEQRQIAQMVAGSIAPAVSAACWQQAWEAIDGQTTGRARRVIPLRRWMGVARGVAAVAAMVLLVVVLRSSQVPTATPVAQPAGPAYAFATPQDSDIQAIETYGSDTPMVFTSGQDGVVVVWIASDADSSEDDKRNT